MITIAYFLLTATAGVPWSPWVVAVTVVCDLGLGAQMPYIIHGPAESHDVEVSDE